MSEACRWHPSDRLWVVDGVTSPCIDAGDPETFRGDEPKPHGFLIAKKAALGSVNAHRDPSFFRTVRERILPELAKLDVIKIWYAGCASGEEVYSMAIMLQEAGIYERSRLYATDFD